MKVVKDLSFVFLMDLGCHQPVIAVNMSKGFNKTQHDIQQYS